MRAVTFILIVGILASAWAANVFLGGLAEDEDAIIRREFSEQLQRFDSAAQAGGAEAQYQLGIIYHTAHELVRDHANAAKWLERAARQGHARAQYELAAMLETGDGIRSDLNAAVQWYRRAADVGRDPDAQYALGNLYSRGLGVGHDAAAAALLYQRAANGGQPVAQYLVGRMFEAGWSVRADPIAAYMWYTLAQKQRAQIITQNREYDPAKALARMDEGMNQSQRDVALRNARAWHPSK